MTLEKDKKANKLEYVNAVRGLAILMVIVLHVSTEVKELPEAFHYMCGKGAYGVQLFFVASAFTLFLSYSNRIKAEDIYTKHNFFIRRFFRISPMYYLAAIIYSIVCFYIPAYNDGKPLAVWKVLINIFYVNSFVPGAINYLPPGGWSVGVEMLFYCCVPFLFAKIKTLHNALKWFLTLSLLSFILKLVIRYLLVRFSIDYHGPENWFLYFWFPNQAPVFILGMVLFFAIKKYTIKSKWAVYVGITFSSLLLLLFTYLRRRIDPYVIIPEHIIVAVFFTVNIFFMSQLPIKIFDNKFTRFLGDISFSLYLVHFIVVYVLADYVHLPVNPYLQFAILLGLTLVISSAISKLTFHMIELRGISWGNRFIKKEIKPQTAAAIQ